MKEALLKFDTAESGLAIRLIEKTNQSFFLTGKAGTGKSTLLRHIIDNVNKNFLVVAPTGIAAINIGGVTIHSFFEFPVRRLLPEEPGVKTFWRESEKRTIISSLDTLIIDEVSMVRADLIDAIDCSLRRNGGNPNLPFGGKQILFVGDLFQLEPIMPTQGDNESYSKIYGNGHFYNARVFSSMLFGVVELKLSYRQRDLDFINLLDRVRLNEISKADIEILNTRVIKRQLPGQLMLTLTTRTDAAEAINKRNIDSIASPPISYSANSSGVLETGKPPADRVLLLKEGAQVIFVRNDSSNRWVNGTIGQVDNLSNDAVTVRLQDGKLVVVERVVWEQIKYEFDESRGRVISKVVGKFVQFPIKLAWAITIHKSQGMSLDQVIVDLGTGAFAGGQTYVALSRVRSWEGLFLNQPIQASDIIVNESLKHFVKSLPTATRDLEEQSGRFTSSGKIGGYYFKIAFEKIEVSEKVVMLNLEKAFAYLTSEEDLSILDSSSLSNLNDLQENSIKSLLLRGIVLFYLGKPRESLDCFLRCAEQTELVLFFMSKCCLAIGERDKALSYAISSINLVRNSRNLYQKAKILKLDTVNDKKMYVECLTDAFMIDPYSAALYSDVLDEMNADNFSCELPTVYEFERAINELEIQDIFFRKIIRTVNRYRKKKLNLSAIKPGEQAPDILDQWNSNQMPGELEIAAESEDFFESHEDDLKNDWSLD